MNEANEKIKSMFGIKKFDAPLYESLLNVYENHERQRFEALKAIDNVNKLGYFSIHDKGDMPTYSKDIADNTLEIIRKGWNVKIEDGMLKLLIPDFPMTIYVKKSISAITYQKNIWERNIVWLIDNLKEKVYFEEAFVWIKFYIPTNDWDVDNRNFKPIIDGLKHGRVFKSDTYKTVKCGIWGEKSSEARTEVFVMENNRSITIPELNRLNY
jgi:hypothetical protein